jgi:hypothetical protein
VNDLVCSSFEFMCDKSCLSRSLLCNGIKNCPSGVDETNCQEKEEGAYLITILISLRFLRHFGNQSNYE